MPARKGAHVDLLLPIMPMEPEIFAAEMRHGRTAALRETRRFWKPAPETAAAVSVPEEPIDNIIRRSLQFSEILGELNPDTGKYCKINGSWWYAALWTTPAAMDFIMLLDTLGYHDVVGRYLEIFRAEQGTVVPLGASFKPHTGYLSTPPLYKSIDWLADNGAILYTLAMHGLLSQDAAFIEEFTETIVRSCDWICASRRCRERSG